MDIENRMLIDSEWDDLETDYDEMDRKQDALCEIGDNLYKDSIMEED